MASADLPEGRWWVALATLERLNDAQDILLESDLGACGWMVALAPDEAAAEALIVRNLADVGLKLIDLEDMQEVFSEEQIAEYDDHLADNFRNIEPGKLTVWGTIHPYKGEGEA